MFRKLAYFLGLFALFAPFLLVTQVSAAGETYSWVNEQTIRVSGGDAKSTQNLTKFNSIQWYAKDGYQYGGSGTVFRDGCRIAQFTITISGNGSTGSITARNQTLGGSTSDLCSDSVVNGYNGKTISIANVQNRSTNATETAEQKRVVINSSILTDADTTSAVDRESLADQVPKNDEITLKDSSGKTISGGVKQSEAVFTGGGGFLYVTRYDNIPPGDYEACSKLGENCVRFTKEPGVTLSVSIPPKNAVLSLQDATDVPRSCESGGGDLSWLLCPVLRQLDSAIGALDGLINDLLQVPDTYFENQNLRDTWSRVRNIAYIILVPIILIMVISTALGFELISAYTVKKALPRLVAAILFIALSYSITTFLIILTNNVGNGVSGLITSSFGGNGSITLSSLFNSTGVGDAGLFVGILTAGAAAVAFTSMGIIMSYALVTFVALLIGFIALSFRQLLLIALILLAPLAILAWIFPGNDKLWKLWWGSFSKLLLLYPLIMAMVGSGRVFARIVQEATQAGGGVQFANTDLVSTLIKLTAYVGPYFFIPAAFKFAGGLFATLAGMANDRGRGLFDTQRKKRAETRAHLKEKSGMGHRFNPNKTGVFGSIGRGLNKTSGWAADPANSFRIAARTQGGKALAAELTQKGALQSQDLAKWMSQAGLNQEALTAIMQNVESNHGHLNMKQLNERAAEMALSDSTQDRAASQQLLRSGQFLTNLTNSEEFSRANIGMAAGYAKASQGFLNNSAPLLGPDGKPMKDAEGNTIVDRGEGAKYANFLNSVAPGLGDTFKTQAGLMSAQAGGGGKVGYSEQVDQDGNYVLGGTAARAIQLSRESVQNMVAMKAGAINQQFLKSTDAGGSSALDAILTVTPDLVGSDGKKVKQIVDENTGEGLHVTKEMQETVLDNLAQVAYGYNTPAETAAMLRQKLASLKANGGGIEEMVKKAESRALRDARRATEDGGGGGGEDE